MRAATAPGLEVALLPFCFRHVQACACNRRRGRCDRPDADADARVPFLLGRGREKGFHSKTHLRTCRTFANTLMRRPPQSATQFPKRLRGPHTFPEMCRHPIHIWTAARLNGAPLHFWLVFGPPNSPNRIKHCPQYTSTT